MKAYLWKIIFWWPLIFCGTASCPREAGRADPSPAFFRSVERCHAINSTQLIKESINLRSSAASAGRDRHNRPGDQSHGRTAVGKQPRLGFVRALQMKQPTGARGQRTQVEKGCSTHGQGCARRVGWGEGSPMTHSALRRPAKVLPDWLCAEGDSWRV